jgi:hypothetical protein
MSLQKGEVNTFTWCRCCMRSHEEGKKHYYTNGHKDQLVKYLLEHFEIIKGVKHFMNKPVRVGTTKDSDFKCFCCDDEVIDNSNNKWIGYCFHNQNNLPH